MAPLVLAAFVNSVGALQHRSNTVKTRGDVVTVGICLVAVQRLPVATHLAADTIDKLVVIENSI